MQGSRRPQNEKVISPQRRLAGIPARRLMRDGAAFVAAFLLASAAIGQAPAPPPAPSAGPPSAAAAPSARTQPPQIPIQSTTRLIQLNVIAQDKNGKPVTGLTKDDFVISDNGKPQEISVFSEESSAAAAPAATRDPDVYTNRASQTPGVTIILIDAMNTRFDDLAMARSEFTDFLSHLGSEDRVAIFALGEKLDALQNFTNDPRALLAAMRSSATSNSSHVLATDPTLQEGLMPGNPADANQASENGGLFDTYDEWVREAMQVETDASNVDRVKRTADALVAIANYVRPIPGRKNLVWISAAFPFNLNMDQTDYLSETGSHTPPDKESFHDEIESAVRAANDADLAIYPVDPRGLIPPSTMDIGSPGMPARPGASTPRPVYTSVPTPTGAPSQDVFDTMKSIASWTGGRYSIESNDIGDALHKALDDARDSYAIGFYPDHNQWNGEYRDIKVSVKRAGVELHYRKGYIASPEAVLGANEHQAIEQNAIYSPLNSTALGMTVKLQRSSDAGAANAVDAQIHVDPQNIQLVSGPDQSIASADVVIAQFDPRGKLLDAKDHAMKFVFAQNNLEHWNQFGFGLNVTIAPLTGASSLRFVVCDAQSNATGSLSVELATIHAAPLAPATAVASSVQPAVAPRAIPLAPAPTAMPVMYSPPKPVAPKPIEIYVRAEDFRGRPVRGLTKSDFTLLDGDAPQTIGDFSGVAAQSPPTIGAASMKGIFSNRPGESAGAPPDVTVILLDALNTALWYKEESRREIAAFLSRVKADDHVAVYGLLDRLVVLQDFTSSNQPLLRDLTARTARRDDADSDELLPLNASRATMSLAQFLSVASDVGQAYAKKTISQDDQACDTANALIEIANRLAGLPGHKTLIWVSGSLPAEFNLSSTATQSISAASTPPTSEQRYREDVMGAAMRAVNDAGLTIDIVQIREAADPGMLATASGQVNPSKGRGASDYGKMPPAVTTDQGRIIWTGSDSKQMKEVAQWTGGRLYMGDGRLDDTANYIRSAIDDSHEWYSLEYSPEHSSSSGEFRDIKINVDRGGVKLQYRRAYIDSGDPPNPREQQVLANDAIQSPMDSSVLGIEASLTPANANLNAHLDIDPAGLMLSASGDRSIGALDFATLQIDNRGNVIKTDSEYVPIDVATRDLETWCKAGLARDIGIAVLPKAAQIRFIVRDEASGATGSLTVPVSSVVPAPTQ
jgi:VWFA-related protein